MNNVRCSDRTQSPLLVESCFFFRICVKDFLIRFLTVSIEPDSQCRLTSTNTIVTVEFEIFLLLSHLVYFSPTFPISIPFTANPSSCSNQRPRYPHAWGNNLSHLRYGERPMWSNANFHQIRRLDDTGSGTHPCQFPAQGS